MKIHYTITMFMSMLGTMLLAQVSGNGNAASDKIKVYFNNPVDTTVATGEKAIFLYSHVDDTLIAYINRAKYTLDIAVYNFIQSSQIGDIAAAVNSAHSKGVRVRWIYNSTSSNGGLQDLDPAIPTLASPQTSEYGIMHNKFMVVDANSPEDIDPIVWTGSCNWNSGQMNYDVNNIIIIQDKSLALAFTTEFNEMWGDSGLTPNLVNSKFGLYKTDNTQHIFNIGGKTIECYFSPSDNTNDRILDVIESANSQIYFGIYTFTLAEDANAILDKLQNEGVYTAGIIDSYSEGFSPEAILKPIMGNMLKVYSQSGSIYHNKLVIVDACDYNSDPVVETGSHNWTYSANTINDENSLIIHDSTIANLYYQSFREDFKNLNGNLNVCSTTGIGEMENATALNVYPNPVAKNLRINNLRGDFDQLIIADLTGKKISITGISKLENTIISCENLADGVYVFTFKGKNILVNKKIIVQHD